MTMASRPLRFRTPIFAECLKISKKQFYSAGMTMASRPLRSVASDFAACLKIPEKSTILYLIIENHK